MLHQQYVLQKTDTYGHFAVRSGRDGEHCLQRPGGRREGRWAQRCIKHSGWLKSHDCVLMFVWMCLLLLGSWTFPGDPAVQEDQEVPERRADEDDNKTNNWRNKDNIQYKLTRRGKLECYKMLHQTGTNKVYYQTQPEYVSFTDSGPVIQLTGWPIESPLSPFGPVRPGRPWTDTHHPEASQLKTTTTRLLRLDLTSMMSTHLVSSGRRTNN